jgi:hypothetical protein
VDEAGARVPGEPHDIAGADDIHAMQAFGCSREIDGCGAVHDNLHLRGQIPVVGGMQAQPGSCHVAADGFRRRRFVVGEGYCPVEFATFQFAKDRGADDAGGSGDEDHGFLTTAWLSSQLTLSRSTTSTVRGWTLAARAMCSLAAIWGSQSTARVRVGRP